MLREEIPYIPFRSTTKTVGYRKHIKLVTYHNPPERGHIDENKFTSTEEQVLVLSD
jgi:hypothetical protein